MINKFIGNKEFHKRVALITFPILVQNTITNFVGMLDNIMIGRIGTDQMSGVSIVNQLIFVFNLCIFGAISGAGIFGAQFFGQGNHEGVKNSFRFKLLACSLLVGIGIVVFLTLDEKLISLYLHEGGNTGSIESTLEYAQKYLFIMIIGLIPFTIEQCYSGTLRETGETVIPMKAGLVAVIINLILNYFFIFGKFGLPELGVSGAAIATVIARFIEAGIVVYWTHRHKEKNEFIKGVYKNFRIPLNLLIQITIKGMPLLVNEFLWSAGMAVLIQIYSYRGLAVVAGFNIQSTISNLFSIVFIAIGSSVAIIVGNELGAGKLDEAKETAYKLIFMSVLINIIIGAFLFVVAKYFPLIFDTTKEAKMFATNFIRINALVIPIHACLHATYFAIRSGGKTFITLLFDCVYVWVITIPFAYFLSYHTKLPIELVFLLCQLVDLVKISIGIVILRSGIWLNDIVSEIRN